MPLRRTLPHGLLALCLLAAGFGATGARQPHPPTPPPPPPAPLPGPAPAPDATAALLRAAAPYLLAPLALPDNPAAFAGEGAVELYHLCYEQVMPSGLSGQVVQRVFQIRSQAGADLFVPDDVWYDSSRTRFVLVRADVLRRHGPVLHGGDRGDLHPGGTGNQPRHVGLPKLRPGDRINLVYVLDPDTTQDWSLLQGHFLGNLFAFRDSYSTLRGRYVLAAPAAIAPGIATSQVGLPAPQRGHSRGGAATWSWQADLQPAYFSSPDGPSITDLSPFVQVSGFASWAAMADWYNNLLAQRAHFSPDLQRRWLQVALDGQPPPPSGAQPAANVAATVARVWGYLSAHLDYNGNESGIHAYVPAPVGQVFQAGEGDCKDGALLLVSWLRAAGVEADLALVRTAAMGQIAPSGPDGHAAATMAAFDHAVVYIPATQQWIDTTAPGFLASELPASDQNSLALIVRSGQRELVHIPVASASANFTRRSLRLTPAGNGWLQADGDIQVRGADAPDLRARYADAQQRRQELEFWLKTYFPRATVDSVAVSGVDPPQPDVRIQFAARIPAEEMHVAWTSSHYTSLLAAQLQRQEALEIPSRWQLEESWTVHLGDNAACAQIAAPPPLHRQGPFGDLTIATSCADGWFQVHAGVVQNAEQVAPDHYGAFRSFWQSVDDELDAPLFNPSLGLLPHQTAAALAPAATTRR